MRLAVTVAVSVLVLGPVRGAMPADDRWPPGVEETIQSLETALRAHEYPVIEGLLAPDFSYAGHGGALARTIMEQVVAGYPAGLVEIEILGVQENPEGTLAVSTRFQTASGAEKHSIRLSDDGRLLQAEVAQIQLAGHSPPPASEGGQDSPEWSISLGQSVVEVPFELRDAFPVPLVEVTVGGRGPYLFAVDTAAACTVLLRSRLATELGLEIVGSAAVGDGSGKATRRAELVRVPELRLGAALARELVGIAHSPSAAHAASIPDDADGILGRVLFESLLLTLDYPGRRLVLREGGRLEPGPSVVPFELVQNVMQIVLRIDDRPVEVILDSGHRGTVTLPASWATRLPLAGPLVAAGRVATVNVTYTRQTARLAGRVDVAGVRIESPALFFSEEHTPSLLGGGLLRHLAVTIDQQERLVRFQTEGPDRLVGHLAP